MTKTSLEVLRSSVAEMSAGEIADQLVADDGPLLVRLLLQYFDGSRNWPEDVVRPHISIIYPGGGGLEVGDAAAARQEREAFVDRF